MYSRFIQEGYYQFPEPIKPDEATALYNKIRNSRTFGQELFIDSEENWHPALGQLVNPEASEMNFLNQCDGELEFIEKNTVITDALEAVLGKNYTILLKKVIVGVQQDWNPDRDWIY